MDIVSKLLQRLKSGGVYRSHVSEPENNDGGQIGQTRKNRIALIGCAKEKRPMDSKDAHIAGDFLVMQDMNVTLANSDA
jgi:hypothetical protein